MDWWKPDKDTRDALKRWDKIKPLKRERAPSWKSDEEFDRIDEAQKRRNPPKRVSKVTQLDG